MPSALDFVRGWINDSDPVRKYVINRFFLLPRECSSVTFAGQQRRGHCMLRI